MAQVLRITLKSLRVMCKTCLSKLSICPSIVLWKKLKSAILFYLSLSIILCQGLAWYVSFLIDLTHYHMGMGIDSSVPFCTQASKDICPQILLLWTVCGERRRPITELHSGSYSIQSPHDPPVSLSLKFSSRIKESPAGSRFQFSNQ